MTLTIPLRTFSEANLREHWAKKAKRVKAQRFAVAAYWRQWWNNPEREKAIAPPWCATLTRIAPRPLDSDNLQRSFKAVRDEIAKQLGVNDNSELIEWKYAQRSGKVREYAVEIQIEAKGEER